jgi:DNA-binding response OmpR family regulator
MASLEELSILVVDDDPAIRSLVRTMLRRLSVGHVAEAADAEAGLAALAAADRRFDLVVCDWNLPGISGIELRKRVGAGTAGPPFLMVTGRDDAQSIAEAAAAGVSAYIVKPFSQAELAAKLAYVVSRPQ